MFAKKTKKVAVKKEGPSLKDKYNAFCYGLLGKKFENDERNEKLAERLRQANFSMTPGLYKSRNIITTVIVTATSLSVYTFIFAFVLNVEMWFLFVIALTGVCGVASYMISPFIVSSRISNRASAIDAELPFTLSELSILASTGLSPVEIFRKIAKRHEGEAVNAEFKKIVYKMDIEGKDVITAVSETARESPSASFREALWDLGNMIHQGGNLDVYLRTKADDVMKIKRDMQKQFVDKLGTYSDIYITIVLIGVLMIGIGAFMMDAMSTSFGGFSSDLILILLTFVILPLAVFVVGLIVSTAYSKME